MSEAISKNTSNGKDKQQIAYSSHGAHAGIQATDWREGAWQKLVCYLPYAHLHTCIFCGKMGIVQDSRRMWSIAFLHHFLESTCKSTPFVHVVLMSMVFQSLKLKTWQDDKVLLCKDCMDWALNLCAFDSEVNEWRMLGKPIQFKRRKTKKEACSFLPMDMLIMFLHAPSEERQLEYRMMCRLLKVLGAGADGCLYAQMPFPILQSVIHGIQTGNISLRKESGMQKGLRTQKNTEDARVDPDCSFFMSTSIAANLVSVCHKLSGEKRLVRNAPDVAKYIRKCWSFLGRHAQKQQAWDEWNVTGFRGLETTVHEQAADETKDNEGPIQRIAEHGHEG